MTYATDPYNADTMAGRPPQKDAPPFGQRLAAARKRKGLSQTELAARLNTTRGAIDYYERRATNPTLDVIQQVAEALEVSVTELLGEEAATVRAASRKAGPTGKVQKVFEDVSKLPRRQQEKIIQVVAALVSQYEQARQ